MALSLKVLAFLFNLFSLYFYLIMYIIIFRYSCTIIISITVFKMFTQRNLLVEKSIVIGNIILLIHNWIIISGKKCKSDFVFCSCKIYCPLSCLCNISICKKNINTIFYIPWNLTRHLCTILYLVDNILSEIFFLVLDVVGKKQSQIY